MSKKIEISIVMSEDGNIQVNGPMRDKIIFFGLLEVARQVAMDYNEKLDKEKAKKEPANIIVPEFQLSS